MLSFPCVNCKEEGINNVKNTLFEFLLFLTVFKSLINLRVLCPACITLNISMCLSNKLTVKTQ